MRLIQATVPSGCLGAVAGALDDHGVDYFATDERGTDAYEAVMYVSTPEEDVEDVLGYLYEAGLDAEDHVVLIDTAVDIVGRTGTGESGGDGHARIAAAELQGKTEDLLPDPRTFVTMMFLSTVVATTGVLLDSSAVVVGSMVLAPLFGPAVSASVGTVIDEPDLFWEGLRLQVVGIGIAVGAATAFAWLLKTAYLVPSGFALLAAPQIVERLSPDLLSLVIAFVAGVISIATASGRALVGVMMAAALLPPAAIVGIGIAWWTPAVALHSGVLLLVNLLAINLAGLLTLWYLGYRPDTWVQVPQTRRAMLKRGGVLLVAILVISAYLWTVSYAGAQRSQLEEAVEEDVGDLLSAERYTDVVLVDVRVEQDRASLRPEPDRVVVTIGQPPDSYHPTLHREINDRVRERAGDGVTVDVRVTFVFRDVQGEISP